MHRMRMVGALAAGALTAGLATACSDTTGPEAGVDRIGVIQWFASAEDVGDNPTWPADGGVVIEAPESVAAGRSFEVVVWTVGNDGCWGAAGMEVENGAVLARLVPIDRNVVTGETACTMALVELAHPADLVFTEAGEATIRVEGRTVIGDDFSEGEAFSIERTITVTP